MSSPFGTPSSSPRRIALLPVRPKSSSGQRGGSQNPIYPHGLSPASSIGTGQSSSNRRHSYHHTDAATGARHLSPPAADPPGAIFKFGQTGSNPQPVEQLETFTFRLLHNVTPRPSPQPEEMRLSPLQNPSTGLNSLSLPILSIQEQEYPQPLPTLYSEKMASHGESGSSEPFDSFRTALPSGSTAGAGIASPSRLVPSLSFAQTLNLCANPALHSRRTSEASMVSEKSDTPAPYDVRDEKAPREPFFTPVFQTALEGGLNIAKSLVGAIERFGGSSEPQGDLNRLLKDAKALSAFQTSDTRTIAVLGDSGEGKSSLINSLLHFPEIAKTGDIGAACTSVVTEYRQKTKDHTAPITIEVEYLSSSEIEELITELVWNYRQLFLPDIESDVVNAKDYQRYQRESEQAWSALEAAFKHQRLFKKELLSDISEGALEKVTDQLIQWTQDLDWPEGENTGIWKSTASTAEECCEKTSIFLQDRFWPFTKIIRVYLAAQVLKTGVVLADLPGLQDTNLARVRATQTYLMKCDHVFIVAKISRAITDQSLKSSLYDVLARHVPLEWEESAGRSLNLAVVCTKSEDINQRTARREFCGPHKRIAESRMAQLDKDIEDAKEAGNRVLKKELKRKQEFLLVDARNSHVKENLQQVYASKVPGGRLEVFCVSNTTYEKFSRKGNADMVHASGIPELRRFCHSVTAGAQLLEAKHFLQSKLSSLLNSIELWANSFPVLPKVEDGMPGESIYEILQDVKAKVSNTVDESMEGFKDTFGDLIVDFLEEKRNDFWEREAKAKGLDWFSWHWTQYNAWCLNNGAHQTAKRDYVNWNGELIWKMRMELAFQWDMLEDEVSIVFDKLLQSIKHHLLNLKSFMREQRFVLTLVEGIDFRIQDIVYKFSLAQQDFAREVKLIRRNASEPNGSAYIVAEMVPAYRSASQESGGGKAARQRSTVQGRITNGTLFPNISIIISKNMDKLARKAFHGLHDKVDGILQLIKDDVCLALASGQQHSIDGENKDGDKEELAAKVKGLKTRHEELLGSFAVWFDQGIANS